MLAWRGDDPANAVYLSQRDVRELQFAKASIATGWTILLQGARHRRPTTITQVLLAGSFGSYLSPASAVRIGLVPQAGAAAHRVGRERGRRGRQDGGAVGQRAGRGRSPSWMRSSTWSCPGGQTSTTSSSTSWRSRDDATGRDRMRCAGALHVNADRRAARLGDRRAPAAAGAAQPPGADRAGGGSSCSSELAGRYRRLAVAYADCGSYGALDQALRGSRRGRLRRRPLLRRVRGSRTWRRPWPSSPAPTS